MALRNSLYLPSPSSRRPPSVPVVLFAVSSQSLPVSPLRLRPLSLSTTATSAYSSASAPPPLISRRRPNIQLLDGLLETDGAGSNGGSSGGGAVGDNDGDNNRKKLLMLPPGANWLLENLSVDLDGSVVSSSSELEKFPLLRMREGLMERLFTDDLFLAKIAAEYEQNFFRELEIVFANVAIAMIVDFMSVHLHLPTASLAPALANIAGPIAQFFRGCPVSALQVAFAGTSYSVAQRFGALALNGAKLFAVGTALSMVRMGVRNALIDARKVVKKSLGGEVEKVPILSSSLAYGLYMAISSNLRYQVLDGVIDQRILEPLLHEHKLVLSATRFAVQTGNAILGSLLWIEYARRTGI